MGSLLSPAYELTIGEQRWTQQALAIELSLAAGPRLDRLIVRFPAAAPLSTAPDDPVSLSLDGGEGSEPVFTGVVTSLRRSLDDIVVTAIDALGQLARYRPSTTFQETTAASVIRSLAEDIGVPVGDLADGVMLPFYAADPSTTAADHATRLATWSGALLSVAGDGGLTAAIIDTTEASLALRYGRELTAFSVDDNPDPDAVTVAGESGAGSSDAPQALRLTADFFAGNRPDGPSAGNLWRFEPALRTADAAGTAGAAVQRNLRSAQKGGRFAAFLEPKLRPGIVFQVADLPDGLDPGPCWIERVRHAIGPDGASTTARFMKGGDSFNPLALLGSLVGAL
jgi:hypothetical protein